MINLSTVTHLIHLFLNRLAPTPPHPHRELGQPARPTMSPLVPEVDWQWYWAGGGGGVWRCVRSRTRPNRVYATSLNWNLKRVYWQYHEAKVGETNRASTKRKTTLVSQTKTLMLESFCEGNNLLLIPYPGAWPCQQGGPLPLPWALFGISDIVRKGMRELQEVGDRAKWKLIPNYTQHVATKHISACHTVVTPSRKSSSRKSHARQF